MSDATTHSVLMTSDDVAAAVAANNGQSHAITGTHWTSVEEGMLQAIVQRANLPKRVTTEHWQEIADQLAVAGQVMGLPLRTGSGCRNKAASMGLLGQTKPVLVAVPIAAQGTFGSLEAKLLIADVLERIAKELRGA